MSTVLGEEYTVPWEDVYAYAHIFHSTICALNEGTILLNKQRVTTAKLPKFLKKWKKIWINEVEDMEFYNYPMLVIGLV